MPIRKEFRQYYGREWKEEIRPRILDRAGHECERCGKPNHAQIETLTAWIPDLQHAVPHHQMWWRQMSARKGSRAWRSVHTVAERSYRSHLRPSQILGRVPKPRRIRVVISVAHLNHDPSDHRDENLVALCQWCHLMHDRQHHHEIRANRKDAERPILRALEAGCGW